MKRLFLFLLTNVLVVVSISIITNIFGLNKYLTPYGVDTNALIVFCLIWGMTGSFVSLFISKWIAKRLYEVQVLSEKSNNPTERVIVDMVHRISKKAGIKKMPEVGLYDSPEINAFATGWSRNHALVALSTGLTSSMNESEVEGVIAHEVAHIKNGDMVTMTLIQGVLNSFVMFLSRIIASALSKNQEPNTRNFFVYYITQLAVELVLMFFASMLVAFFSRIREYSADRDGAILVGKYKMIAALEALKQDAPVNKQVSSPAAFKAMRISDVSFSQLFSSHPRLEKRIQRLKNDKVLR